MLLYCLYNRIIMLGTNQESRGGEPFSSIQPWWDSLGIMSISGSQVHVRHGHTGANPMKDCRLHTWITTGQGKHFWNEDGVTEGKMEILRRRLVIKECRHFRKRTTLVDYDQIWHLSFVPTESVSIQSLLLLENKQTKKTNPKKTQTPLPPKRSS